MKTLADLAAIRDKMKGKVAIREGSGDTRIVVGMATFHTMFDKVAEAPLGFNGNWWLGNRKTQIEFKDLFSLTAGSTATNVYSVEETLASFNPSVWDMSGVGADKTGKPVMIKGCSV